MKSVSSMIACGSSVPVRKPLLVTGHPRAGTGYMAALCGAMGLDVGHERMGADGVSSWMMGPPVWRVPFHRDWQHQGRLWYEFDRVIEVVRSPLPHIASVAFTESGPAKQQQTSIWWRAQWVPLSVEYADPVAQAVQSIVGWHDMMKRWHPTALVVCLEDARCDMARILGRPVSNDPGRVNARPHKNLTWEQIHAKCTTSLIEALERYCDELGYDHQ